MSSYELKRQNKFLLKNVPTFMSYFWMMRESVVVHILTTKISINPKDRDLAGQGKSAKREITRPGSVPH